MIIYRENRRAVRVREALAKMRSHGTHEEIRNLLIEFGQLECGVADQLCEDRGVLDELRRVAVALGRMLYRSWRGLPPGEVEIDWPAADRLPEQIEVSDPEGYAYYGLFPERFMDAAERFYTAVRPRHTVCIGIRSIGTSLSAAVAGTIAELGGSVESITLRPFGHPFDRQIALPKSRWRCDSHFVIVDEGPGLSGSSFCSVARALAECGIPDSRIVLMPSWDPAPASLCNESARARWGRHTKFLGEFESHGDDWLDVSAGKWREHCYADQSEYPAVQPQHECRKFLKLDRMAKFAGFGARGHAAFERARALHDAGFSPAPLELSNGFIVSEFVPGKQAIAATRSCELVRAMAGLLAHVRREMPANRPVPWDALIPMVNTNIEEALGDDWAMNAVVEEGPTYWLDGRMLPHEWIETASGFLKTDVCDHADDHFFPGPQDIAWDVAGVVTEFRFDHAETDSFVDQYSRASGDSGIQRRLPFYLIAYASFRLGYSLMAADADHGRFRELANYYSSSLKRTLRGGVFKA